MARRYTAKQFIEAIPGTGGVISDIAERVGCDWNTAKKYIEEYVTVRRAWEDERNRITDIAENNIIVAIKKGNLSMSKWWLQVMRSEEFVEEQKINLSGGVSVEYVNDWREHK